MPIVRLRGLPWSSTQEDVRKLFEGVEIVFKTDSLLSNGSNLKKENENVFFINDSNQIDFQNQNQGDLKPAIYLTLNAEGRPSGEAFVEVKTEEDVEKALSLSNSKIGQRYVESKITLPKIFIRNDFPN
jgi:heterogeneous nuclear ribonucleoprotein F/H